MSKITQGSYIKIPKGTTVYEDFGRIPVVVKRDTVAQVTQVRQPDNWGADALSPLDNKWTVYWGSKMADMNSVTPVTAPAPRVVTKKGPTLRERMIKGTEWKLTADAQVMKIVAIRAVGRNGNPYRDHELKPDYIMPPGTVIKVTGKFQTYYPTVWEKGLWVPVEVNGKSTFVEFKELNKDPEQLNAVTISQFVIWDKEEKKYFTGNHSWRTLEYTDKLTKAKKFKRLSDVRAYALLQSGYYDNLPESWGTIPDWMCGGKAFDIPRTWEIVKIDKLTKSEIERIELIDTFDRSWKLRALTVKYGSAVRQVYSDLEKKNKLGEFSAIMMFKNKENQWGSIDELNDQQIEEIKRLAGLFGKEVKIQKSKIGFAIAIKDVGTALMVRLAYQGNLDFVLIDFSTMSEIVQEK